MTHYPALGGEGSVLCRQVNRAEVEIRRLLVVLTEISDESKHGEYLRKVVLKPGHDADHLFTGTLWPLSDHNP